MRKQTFIFAILSILMIGSFAFGSTNLENVVQDSVVIDTINETSDTIITTDPTDPSEPIDTSGSLWTVLFSALIPGIIGSLAVLFSDAAKYINTSEWSWSVFFSTKIKPFLYVNIVAIVLLVVIYVFPNQLEFLSDLSGTDLTNLTTASLFAFATAIVDGWLKKKVTTERK